ncbi:ATP-grasp domain-containing protein [Micromonospora sp. NPDC048830]|uniref:ATP-grasp domain-containing protein n=1 Tax=Micromonospora sp. NPDC048830 TaxID=3364257 RepID=UPI003717E0FE
MGHLLVVESWVGAMSALLPRAIREAGHRFTFVTRDLHHYLRTTPAGTIHPLLAAENVLTTETNDVPALSAHVSRLHATLHFDGVLTSCDYYLGIAARLAADLGLPGPAPEAVERAYRKDLARDALCRAGVPGPEFAVARGWAETVAAAERIGYPLVVKPVDLCAGMYVRRADDSNGLRAAFDALAGFPVNARRQPRVPLVLVEELLTGPEVSVETVTVPAAVAGGSAPVTTVVGVTGKSLGGAPWFVESGHLFPADLAADVARAAADTAVAALAAVGLDHGVAHTELRLTPAGPRVIEINPRPAGNQITELIRRVTGIDLPMAYAQLALGEQPDLTPTDTGVRSAAIAFLLPPRAGTVTGFTGVDRLTEDPRVVDYAVKPAGHRTGDASNNNSYLGHVATVDTTGTGALAVAEELVSGLCVQYDDELAGAPA